MTNTYCLSGLVEKRAELSGEIKLLEEKLDQLRSDVLHVDATIRIIDPAFKPDMILPKVRRPRRDWFGTGELQRVILETLRKAPEPLTSHQVALAVMGRKGFDVSDRTTARLVEKRVDAVLRRKKGMVERVVYGPRAVSWRLAKA